MTAPPRVPEVPRGVGTYLGVTLAVLGFAGTVVAAINGSDLPTIVGGTGTLGVFLTLFGLRAAQAIALLKTAAQSAESVLPRAADCRDGAHPLRTDPELLARLDRLTEAVEALAERSARSAADRS